MCGLPGSHNNKWESGKQSSPNPKPSFLVLLELQ